jgi:hypothetical protein
MSGPTGHTVTASPREIIAGLVAQIDRFGGPLVDHACIECAPFAEIPDHIKGFRCWYHTAKHYLTDDEVSHG